MTVNNWSKASEFESMIIVIATRIFLFLTAISVIFCQTSVFPFCCSRYEESAVKVEETPGVEEPGIFQILEQLEETAEALLTRLRM